MKSALFVNGMIGLNQPTASVCHPLGTGCFAIDSGEYSV